MSFKLIISVSRSLLMARLKQTLIAAVGVTFSITMFITLLSFMGGLNSMLDGLVINRTPHVRLYNEILPAKHQPIDISSDYQGDYNFVSSIKPKNERPDLRNSGAIIRTLRSDKRVLGVAPKINAQVFFNVGSIDLSGVVNGIDVEEENRLFTFSDYVVAGDFMD